MSYIYYDPNPNQTGYVGDCTVRAISKLLDLDWDEAYIVLITEGYYQKDMPSSNAVTTKVLENNGYVSYTLPDYNTKYTFKEFAENHPQGKYFLATGEHVVSLIDGDYYDVFDSANCPILYYFAHKDNNKSEK